MTVIRIRESSPERSKSSFGKTAETSITTTTANDLVDGGLMIKLIMTLSPSSPFPPLSLLYSLTPYPTPLLSPSPPAPGTYPLLNQKGSDYEVGGGGKGRGEEGEGEEEDERERGRGRGKVSGKGIERGRGWSW